MSDIIQRGADAMRARRRELIAQPLDRIWPDLMRAAIGISQVNPTDKAGDIPAINHDHDAFPAGFNDFGERIPPSAEEAA